MGIVRSIIQSGNDGTIVKVECSVSNSLPGISIIGFANRSVDEAKDRIRGAMAACNLALPPKKITVNLAPADIPKEGSSLDLPILIAILISCKIIKNPPSTGTLVLGEVGLNGEVRAIRGIIGKILSAKKHGISKFWIPEGNSAQANLVPDIKLTTFSNVHEVYNALNGKPPKIQTSINNLNESSQEQPRTEQLSIDEVAGQEQAKRALLIAAAGHHNILLSGPPGNGKTMLAKSILSIMPGLSSRETLEVTHLNSLASKNFDEITTRRPFRSPHHTASRTSVLGGGQYPKPGEVSLSHHGILFFDEFPEFSRPVIEALRQPLEDKRILVTRAKDSIEFPAGFLFIATANPCPCGYYQTDKECICSPHQIRSYQKKMSGPIIDRIDLYVEVEATQHQKLLTSQNINQADILQKQVSKARQLQIKRSGKLNSELNNGELKKFMEINISCCSLLDLAAERMQLSARAYMRTIRVARTIADLEKSKNISLNHLSEALQYRKKSII